jgi:hypothetical protein
MATNNDQILSSLLAALEGLRKEVADLKGAQASSKPARKSSTPKTSDTPRKPREPTSWDTFRAKVQAALTEGGLKANAMSYASHLKNTYEDAYTWDTEAIIAAFPDYTPPEPKPRKPKSKPEDEDEGEAEDKPKKPRKPMTPEHKAKLQAGAAAYRARLKAEKEAAQADAEPEASPKAASPKAPSPKAAPVKLTPLPFRGKRLVWDPATNGTWLRGPDAEDGSCTKGAWFGILGADKKSMDTNAPEPAA